jgi:hypothetical protein
MYTDRQTARVGGEAESCMHMCIYRGICVYIYAYYINTTCTDSDSDLILLVHRLAP